VSAAPFKFSKIGYWSELKLEIIEKYGSAYTSTFQNLPGRKLKKYYIDAFSGAGAHLSKSTGKVVEGSPARALKVVPSFDRFFFIDVDEKKTSRLAELCAGRTDVEIHTGDATAHLKQILPGIKYENYNRALCCSIHSAFIWIGKSSSKPENPTQWT
jgi:three-Cys-motif partner protein